MPVTINGTTGITDADGGTVLSSADIASQAQAQAGTDNATVVTPLRLRNALNASGAAPIYACRAWVNFNGTGTVAIRGSGNVTSITDHGVGEYTVNFTTPMPDANYCWSASGQQPAASASSSVVGSATTAPTASALRILAVNANNAVDWPNICVAVFR
jgi:hypothetical protein